MCESTISRLYHRSMLAARQELAHRARVQLRLAPSGAATPTSRVCMSHWASRMVSEKDLVRMQVGSGSSNGVIYRTEFAHGLVVAMKISIWKDAGSTREAQLSKELGDRVLRSECECFPIVYGWDVCPDVRVPLEQQYKLMNETEYAQMQSQAIAAAPHHARRSTFTAVVTAMEMADGDLSHLLRQPHPPRMFMDFVVQGLIAVHTLNKLGYTHNDAHDQNFLVIGRRVLIADFGEVTRGARRKKVSAMGFSGLTDTQRFLDSMLRGIYFRVFHPQSHGRLSQQLQDLLQTAFEGKKSTLRVLAMARRMAAEN